MLLVAEMLDEIGLPKGAVSVLPMSRTVGDSMIADDRFKLLSFTGSPDVGWEMKRRAGMKPVVLELGGNAGVVIDEDCDLAFAALLLVMAYCVCLRIGPIPPMTMTTKTWIRICSPIPGWTA